jgi:hypothetical protein
VEPAASDFTARYGFLRKPGYARFRVAGGFRGFSEMSVRTSEFTAAPDGISRAYVIENEITYLAFPAPAAAMVIRGGGYAVPVLDRLGWLAGIDVVYWGDIDTHGFAILDRLRQHLPHARSMLMDRATLLGHREHWTTEPSPTAAALSRLDRAESALYADLISNAYAPSVRLEQERIRFSAVEKAVTAASAPGAGLGWTGEPTPATTSQHGSTDFLGQRASRMALFGSEACADAPVLHDDGGEFSSRADERVLRRGCGATPRISLPDRPASADNGICRA